MHYPGYLLNPGDMFSVDPEMVLFATGTPNHAHRELRAPGTDAVWFQGEYRDTTGKVNRFAKSKPVEESEVEKSEEQIVDEVAELEEEEPVEATESPDATSASAQLLIHKALISLRKEVKNTEVVIKNLTAKRKQDLRELAKELRTAISKSNSTSGKITVDMQKHWEQWFYDILKAIPGNVKIPTIIAYLETATPEETESKIEEGDSLSKRTRHLSQSRSRNRMSQIHRRANILINLQISRYKRESRHIMSRKPSRFRIRVVH